jgi:hypothetical protein
MNGDILLGIFILYHSRYLAGRIVFILQTKDDLVSWIILTAEAFEVIEEVIVKAFQRLENGDGWKKIGGSIDFPRVGHRGEGAIGANGPNLRCISNKANDA